MCLQVGKLEQLDCKIFFVGSFANTYFSMLGLGDVQNSIVKNTICVIFVPKILEYFIVERKKFAQTGNLIFNRNHLFQSVSFAKWDCGCENNANLYFNSSHVFNPSGSRFSLRIVSYDAVV